MNHLLTVVNHLCLFYLLRKILLKLLTTQKIHTEFVAERDDVHYQRNRLLSCADSFYFDTFDILLCQIREKAQNVVVSLDSRTVEGSLVVQGHLEREKLTLEKNINLKILKRPK